MIGRQGDEAGRNASPEEEALRLFVRVRSGQMSSAETVAAAERLTRDTPVRANHDQLKDLWNELGGLSADPAILRMRAEALVALDRRAARRTFIRAIAAALFAVTVIGGAWIFSGRTAPEQVQLADAREYSTRVGQISSIALSDGSTAILDTNSAISARIGATGERGIEMLRGRALFTVAKMRERPFRVRAGRAVVTALGTRFVVYRKQAGLDVNLIEGRVRVEPQLAPDHQPTDPRSGAVEMAPGDQLQISQDVWRLARGGAWGDLDWVKGQLVFDNVPISQVIGELNRYSDKKFILADPELGLRTISAIIRTDDPAMLLRAIRALGIGEIRETSRSYEIGMIAR